MIRNFIYLSKFFHCHWPTIVKSSLQFILCTEKWGLFFFFRLPMEILTNVLLTLIHMFALPLSRIPPPPFENLSFSLSSLKPTFLLLTIAVLWFFCGEVSFFLSMKAGYGYQELGTELKHVPWPLCQGNFNSWFLGFSFNSMNYFVCFQEIRLQVIQKCFPFLIIRRY